MLDRFDADNFLLALGTPELLQALDNRYSPLHLLLDHMLVHRRNHFPGTATTGIVGALKLKPPDAHYPPRLEPIVLRNAPPAAEIVWATHYGVLPDQVVENLRQGPEIVIVKPRRVLDLAHDGTDQELFLQHVFQPPWFSVRDMNRQGLTTAVD